MDKEHRDYLIRREVERGLLDEKSFWDDTIENDFIDAWAELMIKVNSTPDGTAKSFWKDNLQKMHPLVLRNQKLRYELGKLEREYTQLYTRHSELLETVEKLKIEFEK